MTLPGLLLHQNKKKNKMHFIPRLTHLGKKNTVRMGRGSGQRERKKKSLETKSQ